MALLERHNELRTLNEKLERWRAGTIAAAVFCAQGVKKKVGPDEWGPLDFFSEPKPPQTDEEMLRAMEMWAQLSQRTTQH